MFDSSSENLARSLVDLSRMQKTAICCAPSSRNRLLEDFLLSLDLAREKKDTKKLGDFICIRQKWKSSEFYKKIRLLERKKDPASYGTPCAGDSSLYHKFQKQDDTFSFELDSEKLHPSRLYQSKKKSLKLADLQAIRH